MLATLFSAPAAYAGRQARWAVYLYIFLNAPFIVGVMHLYGTMSTPFVAIFPTIVILWAFYFDERIAWLGAALILFWILVVHYLESQALLPYAPALLERSVDAQVSSVWFSASLAAILILFSFAFSITLLILAARRMQDARLHEAHELLERSNRLIRRYVPAQLAEQIIAGQYTETSKPERRKLTICFTDIQGFTLATDELDAEEVAEILNEYLSEMMTIADSYAATVNQLVGDGIMIFFGAPHATSDKDHALRAVRMALDMQTRMKQLHEVWTGRGLQRPFLIRIGINTGYASVGDFGSAGRKLYSGIGIQTNLAARIQSYCVPGRVLISHTTKALIEDEIRCTPLDHIQVKGIHYPVRVYEVATETDPLSQTAPVS
ncbi:MAG: adenylate/guanylate cyclase domain-containing protein [Stenotrophobium sp.]